MYIWQVTNPVTLRIVYMCVIPKVLRVLVYTGKVLATYIGAPLTGNRNHCVRNVCRDTFPVHLI